MALGGLFVAQFLAYRDLHTQTHGKIDTLQGEVEKLGKDKVGLEEATRGQKDLIAEKDRRIDDLKAKLDRIPQAVPAKPTPLPISKLQFTQREISSAIPTAPYAIEVVIQTTVPLQPVRMRVKCSEVIALAHLRSSGIFSNFEGKTEQAIGKEFEFSFRGPAFTPDVPLIATILSKGPIKALSVNPVD